MAVSSCRHTTEEVRNLALCGHAASGKTSLAEALLKHMGVIGQTGRVEDGNTLSDYAREEIEHAHSIYATALQADHKSSDGQAAHVNIIDTPGTPDFAGQAFMILPAVETVAIVVSAARGIEPMTRRMMAKAAKRGLPRMIVINRIDQAGINAQESAAQLSELIASLRELFGTVCLPINLPAENGKAVLDCFSHEDGMSDLGPVSEAHTAIIEQCVEVDEALMATYLDQGTVSPDQLHGAFKAALRQAHLIPICFTAAAPIEGEPVGVSELADIIVRLLPNPREGNPRPFLRGTQADATHDPAPEVAFAANGDPDAHVLAHCFHVTNDPFVGKLCAMRVHQGTITANTELYIGDPAAGESKRPFRVGHLFRLQGRKHVEVDKAIPGDLIAVAKVDAVHYDCVLHDHHDEDAIHLRKLVFPDPLFGVAVTTPNRGDEQKLADALHKLTEEDPTLSVRHDGRTGEMVLSGLGELHLRVVLERLHEQFHVYVETHEPKIAYRETITGKAEGHYRHKKQTGGAGQFGEVKLRVEPAETGAGLVFENGTVGGIIPRNFMPAIEKGIRQAMIDGVLAGYPVHDVKVSVFDGKHHPVDSKEIAFMEAGKRAFIAAFNDARPALLEPMAEAEITIPSETMGSVTSDLTARRGRIMDTAIQDDTAIITAVVPMAEMARYGPRLKSVTSGRGTFTLNGAGYETAPQEVAQRVMAESS